MLSAGDALFRWRSYLPLVLLPLVGLAILRATYPFGTETADLAWEAWCVGLSLIGMALRRRARPDAIREGRKRRP